MKAKKMYIMICTSSKYKECCNGDFLCHLASILINIQKITAQIDLVLWFLNLFFTAMLGCHHAPKR